MTTEVIIACGVDGRYLPQVYDKLVDFLEDTTTRAPSGIYEYKRGKRAFKIRIVYTKEEFKAALNTKDAIVIYFFHSRYGQGPAFGDCKLDCPEVKKYPVNPWEDHFRMGYDAVNVPCYAEILHHCTNPTQIPNRLPRKLFVSKHVRNVLAASNKRLSKRRWQWWGCGFAQSLRRSLRKCNRTLADTENGRGIQSLKDRDYWYIQPSEIDGRIIEKDYWTIVQVGSDDLKSVSLKCSVLFLYSCNSLRHFYWALKRRKRQINKQGRSRSRCVFYLTERVGYDTLAPKRFVELLLKGFNPRSKRGRKKYLRYLNYSYRTGRIVFRR